MLGKFTTGLGLVIAVAAASAPARAGDIKVIATLAWPTVMKEIAPEFERMTGEHLVVVYGGPADVSKRVKGGEVFDVTLSSAAALKDFAEQKLVAEGKPMGVAHTVVIYKKGTKAPDVSTPAAVGALVKQVNKISYTDPATGASTGIFFFDIVKSQGMEEELQKKAMIVKPAAGGVPVNEGNADIGIALTCEVAELKNVEAVRLVPLDPRDTTSFAYGMASSSPNPEGAHKLMDFIASARMTQVMNENGFFRQ